MTDQRSPPRRRPATTIEIPVPGFRKYVGGMGPPLQPLSLALPRDSTAYIIEKLVWPPLKESTPTTRRLLHYYIGFTDLPAVKIMIPCDKALDYLSPREIEDWEYNELEKRIEEKERHEAGKKAVKRRVGRPPKKRPSDTVPALASRATAADDAMMLAEHVAGPSLSTPKKRKRRDEDEDDITATDSESAAIRRQLGAECVSDGRGTGQGEEMGPEYQSIEDDDMADARSTSQSLPPLRPASVSGRGSSSRASSAAPEVRDSSRRSTPRPTSPLPAKKDSTKSLSLTALRPPAAIPKPSPTMSVPVTASSSNTLHPAWAKAFGIKDRAESPLNLQGNNGRTQQNKSFTPTPRTSSFTPQNQPRIQGFTPIPSSNHRPSTFFTSLPTTPTAAPGSAASKKKSKSKAKAKEKTPAKSAEKKPAKKKAKVAEVKDTDDDDDSGMEENVWRVKALLDDRYDHTKEGKKVHMFLVDWEGDYDPSWEPKENIQDDNLISEYQRRKRAGLTRPDKAQKSLLPYLSRSPFANVNEAFEGDSVDPDKAPTVGTRSDGSHSGDELLVVDRGKGPASNGKAAGSVTKPASKPSMFGRTLADYRPRLDPPL